MYRFAIPLLTLLTAASIGCGKSAGDTGAAYA